MKIRARLILSVTTLLLVSIVSLGCGILFVQHAQERQDMERAAKIIENSVKRVALDAMLQKDDLQLVSYVNFLKAQYPALSTAQITWFSGANSRSVNLGAAAPEARISERRLEVADPADPSHRVGIRLGISQDVIEAVIRENQRRLKEIVVTTGLVTSFIWFALAYWLAWSITWPIVSLARVAKELGTGKLGQRLDWKSSNEIGELVTVFNEMSERLAELDETKKNFISSVTHEFRSPLGAIESFVSLLDAKQANCENCRAHRDYLDRIGSNVHRLSQFVNDLLDTAQIEKGKMKCVLMPVNLQETVTEVCKFFEAKIQSQEVSLVNSLDNPPMVLADLNRIRQVLVNLISNALKFTPPGGKIEIAAEQYREGRTRWLEVSVTDTGRGMDERDLARLFQPFSQGRNTAQGIHGAAKGTGLGLHICKSIVEQHGGKINVESAPGKGTRFSFSLKAAVHEAKTNDVG